MASVTEALDNYDFFGIEFNATCPVVMHLGRDVGKEVARRMMDGIAMAFSSGLDKIETDASELCRLFEESKVLEEMSRLERDVASNTSGRFTYAHAKTATAVETLKEKYKHDIVFTVMPTHISWMPKKVRMLNFYGEGAPDFSAACSLPSPGGGAASSGSTGAASGIALVSGLGPLAGLESSATKR